MPFGVGDFLQSEIFSTIFFSLNSEPNLINVTNRSECDVWTKKKNSQKLEF